MTTLAIDSRQIHLWCTFFGDVREDVLFDEYRKLLSRQERQQESRFYFAKDRCRYLLTRALVRTVLSRYVKIRPEQWKFVCNRYGRPEVSNTEALHAKLSFNISHTDGLILLGVAHHHALGVDTENVSTREATIALADRYFAPEETAALRLQPEDRQPHRFFEYWTLKESYIKARGMGLSIPLDKFSFQLPGEGGVRLSIDAELDDRPERWRFWQLRVESAFLAAVCAERVGQEPPELVLREVVPLVSERPIESTLLRVSE